MGEPLRTDQLVQQLAWVRRELEHLGAPVTPDDRRWQRRLHQHEQVLLGLLIPR
jgi:hypothetical protein